MYYLLNSNLSGAQSTQITNPCRTCSLFHSRHPFYGVGTSQLHHIWKKKKSKIHIAVIWAKKTRNKSLHLFPSKGILKDVTMVKTLSPHEGFVVIPVATDSSPHVSRTLRVWTFEEYSTFLSAGKLLQASSARSQNTNHWWQSGHGWMWYSSTALSRSIHLPKSLLLFQATDLLSLVPGQFLCSSSDNSRTVLDILMGTFSGFLPWIWPSSCTALGCVFFWPYIHYDMDHNF